MFTKKIPNTIDVMGFYTLDEPKDHFQEKLRKRLIFLLFMILSRIVIPPIMVVLLLVKIPLIQCF